MANETPSAPVNLTRADITGKVPSANRGGPRAIGKGVKMTGHKKQHARRLKKRGLISETAAKAHGL